jgi:hypothetical protein
MGSDNSRYVAESYYKHIIRPGNRGIIRMTYLCAN